MRILHLGPDVASQMSITVRALRRAGADAVGLRLPASPMADSERQGEGIETLEPLRRDRPIEHLRRSRRRARRVHAEIERADVVHWHFGAQVMGSGADAGLARRLGTPGVVEFWGSDIRIDEIARQDNAPYAARGDLYEYADMETRTQSYRRQARFADEDVRACLHPPGFERYLRPDSFPIRFEASIRIEPIAEADRPVVRAGAPLVVHVPSAPGAKGTASVISAVEEVRRRGLEFEFRLLTGVAHHEALSSIRSAAVVLDQFVVGDAYGAVAVEAMEGGGAVIGWLTDDARTSLPEDLPLVVSDGFGLADALASLVDDAALRSSLGAKGPPFVRSYHDADAFAGRLLDEIYPEVIRSGR